MSYYSVSFVTCKDSRYAVVSSIYFAAHSLEQAKLRQRKTSSCDLQYAQGSKSFPHTRQGIFFAAITASRTGTAV